MHFWKKILLLGLLFILLIYGLAKWGEHWLLVELEQKIAASGMMTYRQMDVSLLRGNVSFSDAAVNWKWQERGKNIIIQSPEIRLDGIRWRSLYFDKKLVIRSVGLQSPDIAVQDVPIDSLSETPPPDTTAGEPPTPKILALEIGRVALNGGCIEVFEGRKRPEMQAANMNVLLDDIAFDFQADEKTAPTIGNADLLLEYLAVNDPLSRHHFTLQKFHLNKRDSAIEMSGLHVDPKDTPAAFFNQSAYKQAWFDLNMPTIRASGLQFDQLLAGAFLARKITFEGPDIKVRTNQNLVPDPKANRPMPQELLRRSPLAIVVDSLVVKKGNLVFENIGPGKTEVGVLTFGSISALFSNVTNDSARIAKQKIMEVEAMGYCQGQYPMYNHLWFDLASPTNAFSFKGNAADVPFVSLNSFIEPNTDVFFDDGKINKLNFDVNADERTATGTLHIDYENLDFSLLNEDRERRKVLSKVVDFLFIKEKNDNMDKDFQPGNIYAERDVRLSFLNYWWTAIQSGIKTSLLDGMVLEKVEKRTEKAEKRRAEKAEKRIEKASGG